MKITFRNVDKEPFSRELEFIETDDLFPHFRITYLSDKVLTLILKSGPLVELVLTAKDLALKRGVGLMDPQQMETIVSTERLESIRPEVKREQKPGIPLRVKVEGVDQYAFETALDIGRYERSVFQGTRLELFRFATTIVTIMMKPGPILDIFVNNGIVWSVDDEGKEQIVMSTGK